MSRNDDIFHVAAICAMPRHGNTGMRCVNHALQKLIEKLGSRTKVDFFCFDSSSSPDSIRYRSILDLGKASDYAVLIIWGDFILCQGWLARAASRLAGASGAERAMVLRKIHEVLFPRPDETSEPVYIVFGQCLLSERPHLFENDAHLSGVRSLLRVAAVAAVRDPISTVRASIISGLLPSSHAGIDAALLLEPLDARDRASSPLAPPTRVGIFFGRTHGAHMTKIALAVSLRRHAPGLETFWIPWFPRERMPWWIAAAFAIRRKLTASTVEEYIQAIRSCRLVITDTYHLSLIAWSYGVPAICIGRGAQHFRGTTKDKKKEIFFISNSLDDFYLFAEDGFGNLTSGAARRAIKLALDPDLGPAVRQRLHQISAEYVCILTSALKKAAERSSLPASERKLSLDLNESRS